MSIEGFKGKFEENFQKIRGKSRYRYRKQERRQKVVVVVVIKGVV